MDCVSFGNYDDNAFNAIEFENDFDIFQTIGNQFDNGLKYNESSSSISSGETQQLLEKMSKSANVSNNADISENYQNSIRRYNAHSSSLVVPEITTEPIYINKEFANNNNNNHNSFTTQLLPQQQSHLNSVTSQKHCKSSNSYEENTSCGAKLQQNSRHKKLKRVHHTKNFKKQSSHGGCERKVAHATAESRYRSSINDQIKKLKSLVAGPNVNWKKSAILETVAEYIQHLKKMNLNLREENLQLKFKLSSTPTMGPSYIVVPTMPAMPALTASNCFQSQYSTIMYSL